MSENLIRLTTEVLPVGRILREFSSLMNAL